MRQRLHKGRPVVLRSREREFAESRPTNWRSWLREVVPSHGEPDFHVCNDCRRRHHAVKLPRDRRIDTATRTAS